LADDVIEEEVEEYWNEDTSLTDAVVDAEYLKCLAIGVDCSASVGMELYVAWRLRWSLPESLDC
jgi:hypothetical protein